MVDLYNFHNLNGLLPIIINFKFGAGTPRAIAQFQSWFQNIFNNDYDETVDLIPKFFRLGNEGDQKSSFLFIVPLKEIRGFYELFDQFCVEKGFGGIEHELRKKLTKLRKLSTQRKLKLGILVQHSDPVIGPQHSDLGIGRIQEIKDEKVIVLFANAEEKEIDIKELEIISLREEECLSISFCF